MKQDSADARIELAAYRPLKVRPFHIGWPFHAQAAFVKNDRSRNTLPFQTPRAAANVVIAAAIEFADIDFLEAHGHAPSTRCKKMEIEGAAEQTADDLTYAEA